MTFSLVHADQSIELAMQTKHALYQACHAASRRSNWMRLSGIAIAAASSVVTAALHIGQVVEPILKGIANIFGSPFSNQCDLKRGVKQLLIGPFLAAFAGLVFGVADIALTFFTAPLGMAFYPKTYTKQFETFYYIPKNL